VTERYARSRLLVEERPMPRYFFHVIDGRDIPDEVGTVLSGLSQTLA
jgi:uncharacterized protein DUF6894